NGARCFGRFTAHLGEIVLKKVTFETMVGTLAAEMVGDDVRIAMSEPTALKLNTGASVSGLEGPLHFINTGVPHVVHFVETPAVLDELDVFTHGGAIRNHSDFAPAGTNANFAAVLAPDHIAIRTF